MASGQTQYYGLSQWEAADKVERVDFNSDNAKIDGALHQLAQCTHFVSSISLYQKERLK